MSKSNRAYLLRNTTKARVKIAVQGSRAQLAYKDLARASAMGENTKIQRGIRQLASGAHTDGEALRDGMLGMLDRIGASTEQYARVKNLDPDVLASMYESNDLTFEVFFNYEGVTKKDGKYLISDEKRKDIDWFLREYDKVASVATKQGLIDSFGTDLL